MSRYYYDKTNYPIVIRRPAQRDWTLPEINTFSEDKNVEGLLQKYCGGEKKYNQRVKKGDLEILVPLIRGYLAAAWDLRDSLRQERATYIRGFDSEAQRKNAEKFERKVEKLIGEFHLEHILEELKKELNLKHLLKREPE